MQNTTIVMQGRRGEGVRTEARHERVHGQDGGRDGEQCHVLYPEALPARAQPGIRAWVHLKSRGKCGEEEDGDRHLPRVPHGLQSGRHRCDSEGDALPRHPRRVRLTFVRSRMALP